MLSGEQRAVLEYVAHISRGPDNVDTHTVEADSDPQAFDLAIAWAASLGLAADDDVVLEIKLPSGAFKTFVRKDF
jgi:hypothetical protein